MRVSKKMLEVVRSVIATREQIRQRKRSAAKRRKGTGKYLARLRGMKKKYGPLVVPIWANHLV